MLRNVLSALAGAALAAICASPAAALDDATGTYTGKMKCEYLDAGNPLKEKHNVTVRLVEDGNGERLGLDTDGGTFVSTTIGQVIDSTDKPDRGKYSGLSCTLNPVSLNGSSVHADLTIKPGSEKGSIKGTVHVHQPETAGFCTFSAKRTATVAPSVFLCK
jgi:hypothetical protein